MDRQEIIENTILFVQRSLQNAEGGHDWWHTYRVWKNSKEISNEEDCDLLVVELAALLHDIADSKFHNGNESIGPEKARDFLAPMPLGTRIVDHIVHIVANISFKNSLEKDTVPMSMEMQIVQDADRLDAIGAVGIARAFNYGGFQNRLLFDPNVLPNLIMTKSQYKKSDSPTINHFYEKLLLLHDKMNTKTGKSLARKRHDFMVIFLDQFFEETGFENWRGKLL